MSFLLALTFFLAPTYVLRFKLLGLPANFLMLWIFLVWIIFAVWLVRKKQLAMFVDACKNIDKKILWLTGLFFLAGVLSLFIGGIDRAKLGQFIVLFLQPISLFFIANFIFQQNPKSKPYLLTTIYCLLALAGLYAVLQYFTLLGLPPLWWGNSVEPKRALSFFVHPNFYALWSAPLLALLIPDVTQAVKSQMSKVKCFKIFSWLLGALGLLLSLSRSGWLGLGIAMLVYFIVAADKKIRLTMITGVILVAAIIVYYPNLRYRVLLPFYGEKSASSRIELWHDGLTAVKQSPIFGLGLTGFAKEYSSLNTDPSLDTHNFPHNIFLDLWVETGLIGLISLIGLIGLYIYRGLKNRQDLFKFSVTLFLIALVSQGLIDNPYLKNDLALVFWIILSLFHSLDQ